MNFFIYYSVLFVIMITLVMSDHDMRKVVLAFPQMDVWKRAIIKFIITAMLFLLATLSSVIMLLLELTR